MCEWDVTVVNHCGTGGEVGVNGQLVAEKVVLRPCWWYLQALQPLG
jgi:hypothetical protein